MADQATITAEPRTAMGKKVKALRRAGTTPIHVYGHGAASLSLQADTHELVRTIQDIGYTSPLTVKVGDEEHFVMINHVQRHPVSELLLHVDLIRISRTERIRAAVPLHFEGEAPAAREEGAQLYEDMHSVDIEALPTDIPHAITVDISVLSEAGAAIHARNLSLPPAVTLLTDPDATVARIVHRAGAVEEALEEAAEGTEGGQAPEERGEQA